MTREEALNIIRFVFLNEDNQLNDGRQISGQDIHEALVTACEALCFLPWKSSFTSVPEGNKSQILSFDDEGYFYLGRTPHPDSVSWCFAKELLPNNKKL